VSVATIAVDAAATTAIAATTAVSISLAAWLLCSAHATTVATGPSTTLTRATAVAVAATATATRTAPTRAATAATPLAGSTVAAGASVVARGHTKVNHAERCASELVLDDHSSHDHAARLHEDDAPEEGGETLPRQGEHQGSG